MGEGQSVIMEAMQAGEACLNVKPLQKQVVKVIKQWEKQCAKIATAAARNENLAGVAAECQAAVDAAKQAAAAGDQAVAENPEEAQSAYEAVFEYGDAIQHAQ